MVQIRWWIPIDAIVEIFTSITVPPAVYAEGEMAKIICMLLTVPLYLSGARQPLPLLHDGSLAGKLSKISRDCNATISQILSMHASERSWLKRWLTLFRFEQLPRFPGSSIITVGTIQLMSFSDFEARLSEGANHNNLQLEQPLHMRWLQITQRSLKSMVCVHQFVV